MTKKEAYMIAKLIVSYYEQIKFDQNKLDAWYEILKAYEFERVKANLEWFVKHSEFPPKVKDLIQNEMDVSANVPGYQETQALLEETYGGSSSEIAQQELAKIRKILGINGDHG